MVYDLSSNIVFIKKHFTFPIIFGFVSNKMNAF